MSDSFLSTVNSSNRRDVSMVPEVNPSCPLIACYYFLNPLNWMTHANNGQTGLPLHHSSLFSSDTSRFLFILLLSSGSVNRKNEE